MEKNICVIGAANLDISGAAFEKLRPGESNPGAIAASTGGVGRNIAENLARLGARAQLITALGGDDAAVQIEQSCARCGVGLDYALRLKGARTSRYVCLNGPDGEMALAVSDMEIYHALNARFLGEKMDFINRCDMAVIDANLDKEAIEFAARAARVRLMADPVSFAKAPRLRGALGGLFAIKPNAAEAEALCGIAPDSPQSAARCARAIRDMGVENVFITLGGAGVYCLGGAQGALLRADKCEIRNTTGCGDAFTAAAAVALCGGACAREAARYALYAAALTARAPGAIHPRMSPGALCALSKTVSISED